MGGVILIYVTITWGYNNNMQLFIPGRGVGGKYKIGIKKIFTGT
jgi:hypothetical protein